jgi:hypothetical protein
LCDLPMPAFRSALSKLGKFAPAKPRAPMFKKERRDNPSQNFPPDLP